jgi:hypothetical protein
MTWIGWSLLSALFAAATALLVKKGVAKVDPNLATATRTTVVVLFAGAIAIGVGVHHNVNQIGRMSWIYLAVSGLLPGPLDPGSVIFVPFPWDLRRKSLQSISLVLFSSSCSRAGPWRTDDHSEDNRRIIDCRRRSCTHRLLIPSL